MNNKLAGIAVVSLLSLGGCSTTSHFGVVDRAATVPPWVKEAEAALAKAEASPGAQHCPEEMVRARKYASEAMVVYWGCNDADAKLMLGKVRQIAAMVENCGKEPAPTPPPPPQAPASHTLELFAETLFAFNRWDLSAQGKGILDDFLRNLATTAYQGIRIVGYADPIGSDAYNQRLSERRAQAVANYLIANGVPQSSVHAEGRGERELKVTYQQCVMEGAGKGKALIQCYQPNRRVEVTINGMTSSWGQ